MARDEQLRIHNHAQIPEICMIKMVDHYHKPIPTVFHFAKLDFRQLTTASAFVV